VDEPALVAAAPDLILTQDTCELCAVSSADLACAVGALVNKDVRILSLSPKTLDDVWGNINLVAIAAGVPDAAQRLTTRLADELAGLRASVAGRPPPRVLFLEWLSPPMVGGHWTPSLIEAAGGVPVSAHPGAPTRAVPWRDLEATDPDVIVLCPCGFPREKTLAELPHLLAGPLGSFRAVQLGRLCIIDGNAYFNRPGPRLVESAKVLAAEIARLPA